MLIAKRVIYYQVENVYYSIFPETRMRVIDIVGGRLRVITPHGHDILVTDPPTSEEEGARSGYRVRYMRTG